MIFYVDIRDYFSGDIIDTILKTENCNEAHERARRWNEEHNVTDDDIMAFYNEDVLMHEDGHICQIFADVFEDDTQTIHHNEILKG